MFVPIRFNVKYKEYPDAPKATRNSKIMGYVMSWPVLLLLGIQVWDMFSAIIVLNFDGEKQAASFIAALITIIIYGLFLRFTAFLNDIIDKKAVIEAYTNKFTSYHPEIESMKSAAKKKSILASLVCIALGFAFAGLGVIALPHKAEHISNFSGESLRIGKTYYADELYVIGSYAKEKNADHKYYVSAFRDNDGEIYLLSFDPGKKTDARRRIDENDPSELCTLSVYVAISDLKNELYGYYVKAVKKIQDAKTVYMNAEYVCSAGENFMLHSIDEKAAFRFTMAVILVLLGLYMMKGAVRS